MASCFRFRATILLAELNFSVSQGTGPAGSETNAPALVTVSEWTVYTQYKVNEWPLSGQCMVSKYQ